MKRETIEKIREACVYALYAQRHPCDPRTAMGVEDWKQTAKNFYLARGDSGGIRSNQFHAAVETLMYQIFERVQNEIVETTDHANELAGAVEIMLTKGYSNKDICIAEERAQAALDAYDASRKEMTMARRTSSKELQELVDKAGLMIQHDCGGYRVCRQLEGSSGYQYLFPADGICPIATKRECVVFVKGLLIGKQG